MNLERAAMKGRLEELKQNRAVLALRCSGLARSIRELLNTFLTPVERMEIPMAAQQMDDLAASWGELAALDSEIERLNRELD